MKTEKGNALFLILIAVALFAALSYAMTQSGRGGKGIDNEQIEIDASVLLSDLQRLRSSMQRLRIIGGYDQVFFSTASENNNGTCYRGKTPYSPCRNIGLFNSETGVTPPIALESFNDPVDGDTNWYWMTRQLIVEGSEVGTTEPDISILVVPLSDEICLAINKKGGVDSIGSHTWPTSAGYGSTSFGYRANGTYIGAGTTNYAGVYTQACSRSASGINYLIFTVEEK